MIGHPSRLLMGLVLLYAVVAAGSWLFLAYVGVLADFGRISIVVAWVLIILLFATGQYALAGLIARAKAHALAGVQAEIERLLAGRVWLPASARRVPSRADSGPPADPRA